MKTRSTQNTVKPKGYTGKNFNNWISHIVKLNDKITKTTLAERLSHSN